MFGLVDVLQPWVSNVSWDPAPYGVVFPPPSPCWAFGEAAKVMPAHNAEILSSVQLWDTRGWGRHAWAPPNLGTCHPAALGGQGFGTVQSSLKADVVPPHLGVPAIVGNKSEERPGYHERSPALAPTLDSPQKKQPYRVWEIGHPKHGAVMGHQPLFQLLPGSHLVPRTPPKSPCLSSLLLVPEIKQRTGCQGQDLPTLNWASRNWTPKSEPVTVGSTNNHWREIIIYSSDLDTFPQWDE